MAILTNPISGSNLVERFNDFVAAAANANITWGTDAKPFTEMPTSTFGGVKAGRGNVTGNLGLATSNTIDSTTLINAFTASTKQYTRIRNLRARLNVTGGGGNSGTRPTAGIVYDEIAVAHLNSSYELALGSIDVMDIQTDELITRAGLQGGTPTAGNYNGVNLTGFFVGCRDKYNAARATIVTVTTSVCHASCHRSCHNSRSRR